MTRQQELELLAELKERIDYDLGTGIFKWKPICSNTKDSLRWNSRHAGTNCGAVTTKGYIYISISLRSGVRFRSMAHRLAWFFVYGYFPNNEIDHINRQRDDNRIANLRLADRSVNMHNTNIAKNNKSGVTGVHWKKSHNKWSAQVYLHGHRNFLGLFDELTDAHISVNNFRKEHGLPLR